MHWIKNGLLAVTISVATSLNGQLHSPSYSGSLTVAFTAESNAVYVVERSTTLTNWTEISRNDSRVTNRWFSFSNDSALAFFRVRRTNEPLALFALSASEHIDLAGHNLETDSFDSSNPLFSTHGSYDPAKRRDNGSIHSQSGITNSGPEGTGHARIYGRVATEPSAPLAIGTNGFIGTFYAINPGQIQQGWVTNKTDTGIPIVDRPTLVSPMDPMRDRDSWDGNRYNFVFDHGDYVIDQWTTLSGKALVRGTVRIHVRGARINMTVTNDVFRIRTNSSVTIYAECGQALFGGVGIDNPNSATNFIFYGSDRCTNFVYRSTNAFTGIIYAPAAEVELGCDANTPIEIHGAIVGKRIKLIGPVRVHYDEDLLQSGPMR